MWQLIPNFPCFAAALQDRLRCVAQLIDLAMQDLFINSTGIKIHNTSPIVQRQAFMEYKQVLCTQQTIIRGEEGLEVKPPPTTHTKSPTNNTKSCILTFLVVVFPLLNTTQIFILKIFVIPSRNFPNFVFFSS